MISHLQQLTIGRESWFASVQSADWVRHVNTYHILCNQVCFRVHPQDAFFVDTITSIITARSISNRTNVSRIQIIFQDVVANHIKLNEMRDMINEDD